MPNTIALVHEENGIYGISFPDFPGCISTADTLDDAIARGGMALALHVEGMREDGEALPVLRSATDIRRSIDVGDAVLAAVPVELPGRSVRVQITMDEHLLAALDRAAEAAGATRSGKIAEAVRDAITSRPARRPVVFAGGSALPNEEQLVDMASSLMLDPATNPELARIAQYVVEAKSGRAPQGGGAYEARGSRPLGVLTGKTEAETAARDASLAMKRKTARKPA